MFYYVVSLVLFMVLSMYLFIEELSIAQTQFYEIKRYLLYKKENKRSKRINIIISLVSIFFLLVLYIFKYKWLILVANIFMFLCFYKPPKEKIIKLKYTRRIIRILGIYSLLLLIFSSLSLLLNNLLIIYLMEIILILFVKYCTIVSLILALPIERIIASHYKKLAINKLKKVKPIIIGITGSYGKTSTKNYLYQLLSIKYKVCKTPKSYNTYLGIIKSINEDMSNDCQIMIIELGADKIKGLDKILSLIYIDIGIITSIGPQHLKTFKSIDNIVNEKIKVLKVSRKKVFLNYNYEYLRVLNRNDLVSSTTYSFYEGSDIYVDKIKQVEDYSVFDLHSIEKNITMVTNILGKHQLENLIGSVAISLYFNIPINDIKEKIKLLYNENNRMQIRYMDNIKIIDDSYNSNVIGFKSALDVISLNTGYKVLITPGVIELGSKWETQNKELGEYASSLLDYVVLVGRKVTRPFYLGLMSAGFNEENVLIVDSFAEGIEYIKNIKKDNIVVLIENDLPDYYLK